MSRTHVESPMIEAKSSLPCCECGGTGWMEEFEVCSQCEGVGTLYFDEEVPGDFSCALFPETPSHKYWNYEGNQSFCYYTDGFKVLELEAFASPGIYVALAYPIRGPRVSYLVFIREDTLKCKYKKQKWL